MNWKLKAHTLAILSRLPGGRRAYHTLQIVFGTNRLDPEEGVRRAVEIGQLIAQAGQSLHGATVLEIGTGWRPFLPFLLSLAGAKRIITLDVNPWLTLPYALETYRVMKPHLALIADQLNLDPGFVQERYDRFPRTPAKLKDFLEAVGIEYHYPGDASRTNLPDASVDFVCSSNVLAHVPPDALRAIHAESFRILRPSGLVAHRFSLHDLFAGADRSIAKSNFVRYSPREWHWYGGSGLGYNNRLRGLQHRELFVAAGFSVLVDKLRIDPREVEAITSGALPVHSDYARFTPDQLAAEYMWFVGRKDAAVRSDERPPSEGQVLAAPTEARN